MCVFYSEDKVMKSALHKENEKWVKSDYVSAAERRSLMRDTSLLWLTKIVKQFRLKHNREFVFEGDIVVGP